ncbi:sce7726 family protein [Agrobacterium sp. CMT1]|uniref:sce7726 family protein n=1 Tax=Agrobacterium sp. CMT1 TaxID=3128901 RepID=UPI000DD9EEE7
MMNLDEESLKCRMLAWYRRQRALKPTSVIASEFVLGQTGCRSDLAIWNGAFIGVEIKSARDSLVRLPDQITAYLKFFDNVILLCDEIHLSKAETLCPLVVGIYVWRDGEVHIHRPPVHNSSRDRLELARAVSVRVLQSSLGVTASSASYSRTQLEKQVVENPAIDVNSLFTASFKTTYEVTTRAFLRETSGRRIRPDHLRYLSRYAVERDEIKRNQANRAAFWMQWEVQAQAVFG